MKRYPYIQRTESAWPMAQLLISLALAGAALGLYAVAASLDEQSEASMRQLAAQRAEKARAEMPASLAEAYERGLADAGQACAAREVLP